MPEQQNIEYRGLIEAWGRGTISIINTCKETWLPEPELIEEDGGFMVTLFKNNSRRITRFNRKDYILEDKTIKK